METENQPQKGQTIFIEYSRWKAGQHFITVTQTIPGTKKKVITGRIFLEFDENKKATYRAESPDGKELFGKTDKVYELKNKFKEHGERLAKYQLEKGKESHDANTDDQSSDETEPENDDKGDRAKLTQNIRSRPTTEKNLNR